MTRLLKKIMVLTLIGVSLTLAGSAVYAEVIMIVNSDVKVRDLDSQTIRKIYLKQVTEWEGGEKIVPVTLKSGEAFNEFVKEVVKLSPSQFSTYWKRALFTGTGIPPKAFDTEEEVIAYVAETKGAIAHVSSPPKTDKVKIIRIK